MEREARRVVIMSVDLGDARTGLAVCDRTEMLASPAGVIQERNSDTVLLKVMEKAAEHRAELIVIGYPKNMNGSVGDRGKKAEEFVGKLKSQGLEALLWDERQTTVMAHSILNVTDTRGKKRKAVIDAVAATLILENYLSFRKHQQNKG